MKFPKRKNERGFTLIESIVYVGLTGFLLVSVLASTYPILTGAEKTSQRITRDVEAAFVLRKIGWALSSVTSVSLPVTSGFTLSVNTVSNGVLSFTESGGALLVSTNGGAAVPITASRVVFSNLSFTNVAPSGTTPRAIQIEFDADGAHIGPVTYYARY
jgi:type II secretory pathway pseudopilin PulG